MEDVFLFIGFFIIRSLSNDIFMERFLLGQCLYFVDYVRFLKAICDFNQLLIIITISIFGCRWTDGVRVYRSLLLFCPAG